MLSTLQSFLRHIDAPANREYRMFVEVRRQNLEWMLRHSHTTKQLCHMSKVMGMCWSAVTIEILFTLRSIPDRKDGPSKCECSDVAVNLHVLPSFS